MWGSTQGFHLNHFSFHIFVLSYCWILSESFHQASHPNHQFNNNDDDDNDPVASPRAVARSKFDPASGFSVDVNCTNEFRCADGPCIPRSWQCDEENDCEDNSDEADCRQQTCAEDQYPCTNGKCIPKRWMCDEENDCGDRSDENPDVCKARECEENQFQCHNSSVCIPMSWRCDQQKDCRDASDERNCANQTCSPDQFQCADGRRCLTAKWRCDQDKDCFDGSDERDCPSLSCNPDDEFKCADNSTCINDNWKCDGDEDCPDMSDEDATMCKDELGYTPHKSSCGHNEFQCDNFECIHKSWYCDGDSDCVDRSDEVNCTDSCTSADFRCRNYLCIPLDQKCDGNFDCQAGEDEDGCPRPAVACNLYTHFDCLGDGSKCLEESKLCDSVDDCGNKADENEELCKKDTNECLFKNGNCGQICVNTRNSYYCKCKTGFKLLENNHTCGDINECDTLGTCSHKCTNTKGHFKCVCEVGYTLDPNFQFCKADGKEHWIIFANKKSIRGIHQNTGHYEGVIEHLRSAIGMDYDFATETVYWSDIFYAKIYSSPMGTSNRKARKELISHVGSVDSIAIDWVFRHIYWTDSRKDTISVATLNGTYRKTLFASDLDEPRAIALDPTRGWMYWTDWGFEPKIEKAGMDGSHRRIIVKTPYVQWPNGLSFDLVSERIYWVDAKLHTLMSADNNGNNLKTILSSSADLKHPFSIAVFEDSVYWTDWTTHEIKSINKFTGANLTLVGLSQSTPMEIKVYQQQAQPQRSNPCGSSCAFLCLGSPRIVENSDAFACSCPDDWRRDKTNRDSCVQNSRGIADETPSKKWRGLDDEDSVSTTSSPGASMANGDVHPGRVAAVVIGAILILIFILIAVVVTVFVWRRLMKRGIKSLNFDNPVYRRTTESDDTFSLEKHQYHPGGSMHSFASSMEPLTGSASGNECI